MCVQVMLKHSSILTSQSIGVVRRPLLVEQTSGRQEVGHHAGEGGSSCTLAERRAGAVEARHDAEKRNFIYLLYYALVNYYSQFEQ